MKYFEIYKKSDSLITIIKQTTVKSIDYKKDPN